MISTNGKEFRSVVTGKNFLTPKVISYWQSGNYQCELSKGPSFDDGDVYGVTVVNTETMEHEHDLSKPFNTRKDALNYIKVLGK